MDVSTNFVDFVELHGNALGDLGAIGGGHGLAPAAGGATRPARASYLEITGKECVQKINEEERYVLHAVGCRCWFCPRCCLGRGLALRKRLIEVVSTFKGLLMWTFTVDPKLFSNPEEAFHYVRDNRCISETMRRLRKAGHLHSDRYFCVTEWQKETQMAHYHVLLDASKIPFDEVCDIWNAFRPESAGPIEGDRPGFGSIRFSKKPFKSGLHAARYACKYLIKFPEHGYPAWVLDHSGEHQVHRYSTSRGFWGGTIKQEATDEEIAAELASDDAAGEDDAIEEAASDRPTIRKRIAKCGGKSVILRISEAIDTVTGEAIERKTFVCRLDEPFDDLVLQLHRSAEGKRRLTINRQQLAAITGSKGSSGDSGGEFAGGERQSRRTCHLAIKNNSSQMVLTQL